MFTMIKFQAIFLILMFWTNIVFAYSVIVHPILSPAPEIYAQGEVTLKIIIMPDGAVTEARIIKSSIYELLNQEAMNFALKLEYEPFSLEELEEAGIKRKYDADHIVVLFEIDSNKFPKCNET